MITKPGRGNGGSVQVLCGLKQGCERVEILTPEFQCEYVVGKVILYSPCMMYGLKYALTRHHMLSMASACAKRQWCGGCTLAHCYRGLPPSGH